VETRTRGRFVSGGANGANGSSGSGRPQRPPPSVIAAADPGGPGWVDRRSPGLPWGEPPRGAPAGVVLPPEAGRGHVAPPAPPPPTVDADAVEAPIVRTTSGGMAGAGAFVIGGSVLAVVMVVAHLSDIPQVGRVLVPVAALFLTIGLAQWLQRRHPDEPWL